MEAFRVALKPMALATEIPTDIARSLTDPVGLSHSFFKNRLPAMELGTREVSPSPRETGSNPEGRGRKSRNLQMPLPGWKVPPGGYLKKIKPPQSGHFLRYWRASKDLPQFWQKGWHLSLMAGLILQAALGCLRTVRVIPRAFILFSMIVEILARGRRIIK